ncbi:hypothetical protein BJ170DRAFT_697189 [Xylariales sp. AK1849]|nr:hypothetical protein BJ170DRAFT_697189 [Xylariales sp. AK1849]
MDTQSQLQAKENRIGQLQAQLRAVSRTNWAKEKAEFEARLRGLENENTQLRDAAKGQTPLTKDGEDGGDTVTVTKGQVEHAKKRYQDMADQLEAKNRECAELSMGITVSETQILEQWKALRLVIRNLSTEWFNEPVMSKIQDEQSKQEFMALSTHWMTYLNGSSPGKTCLIFQAVLWRHLYHRLFYRAGRCWGQTLYRHFEGLSNLLNSQVDVKDYVSWRHYTSRLFHRYYPIDNAVVTEVTAKIHKSFTPFTTRRSEKGGDEGDVRLKETIHKVVVLAAELSAIFASSRVVPLMANHPKNKETCGFAFDKNIMVAKGVCGGNEGIVDMMISPCLLRRDEDAEYQLLVKADVVRGGKSLVSI